MKFQTFFSLYFGGAAVVGAIAYFFGSVWLPLMLVWVIFMMIAALVIWPLVP